MEECVSVEVKAIVVDGFTGEVTLTLNEYYAIGIAPQGIYRWTNTEKSFFDVDGHGIKIVGVDLIDNM